MSVTAEPASGSTPAPSGAILPEPFHPRVAGQIVMMG